MAGRLQEGLLRRGTRAARSATAAAAGAAARAALMGGELESMRVQLIADAAAALLVLLTAAALSVFKPRGLTGYGRCRQRGQVPQSR